MLVECVAAAGDPRLRAEGLIERCFFIRYWLEGPHVRLRVLPTRAEHGRGSAPSWREALDAFLRAARPCTRRTTTPAAMFKRDVPRRVQRGAWNAEYGADGEMPFRANNSVPRSPTGRSWTGTAARPAWRCPSGTSSSPATWSCGCSPPATCTCAPCCSACPRSWTCALCFTFLPDDEARGAVPGGTTGCSGRSYQEAATASTSVRPRLRADARPAAPRLVRVRDGRARPPARPRGWSAAGRSTAASCATGSRAARGRRA